MAVDFQKLLSDPNLVAFRLRGRDWPRSIFRSPEPIPDGWSALVESEQGAQRLLGPGSALEAGPHDTITLVRRAQHVLTLVIPATAQDHESIEVCVRWNADVPFSANDLASIAEWAASVASHQIDIERLRGELSHRVADALQKHARQYDATWLCDAENLPAIQHWLADVARAMEFDRGVRAARVDVESIRCPRLDQRRAEERGFAEQQSALTRRTELERAARAAAQERLSETAAMLDRLRANDGQRSLREVLHATPAADRTRLLSQLWRVGAATAPTAALAAVGGHDLVVISLAAPSVAARHARLPESLGALSAITFDVARRAFWIGAERGLWRVAADDANAIPIAYPISAAPRRRAGVNAIVVAAERVYATHSGVGLWSWLADAATPGGPADLGRAEWTPAESATVSGVRGATLLADGRLGFAVDEQVFVATRQAASADGAPARPPTPPVPFGPPAAARIRSLAASRGSIFAGLSNGVVAELPWASIDRWVELDRTDRPVASLVVRRWFDVDELLIPAGPRGVVAHYGDGASATLLPAQASPAGNVAIDRVWAADDIVIGLNQDLGRAYLLSRDAADGPAAIVAIARLLGTSVEDLATCGEFEPPTRG